MSRKIRDIGQPSPGSKAVPIKVGSMYWDKKVTKNWETGYPVWEGRWPNGTRIRAGEDKEPGYIYEFIPEGTKRVCGQHGEYNAELAMRDTYRVKLDRENISIVYGRFQMYGEDEIVPMLDDDPEYVFEFNSKLAYAEFQFIAECMTHDLTEATAEEYYRLAHGQIT